MQQSYLSANGIRLHYVSQGNGPLMLFLHGFPEFWYSWRHQIETFCSDYKAVALDMRGYNKSDKPPEKSAYVVSELTKDVAETIQALGYEKCILVGHDWGGAIAWNFAYAYPEMIERLIVLNIPHPAKFAEGLRTPRQLLRSWYIAFFQLPVLPELLLKANNYAAIRSIFREQVVNPNALTESNLEKLVAAAAQPGALTSMLDYYRNLSGAKGLLNKQWDVLRVPTLMIWGENDLALGKELTYGTQQYVSDLTIRYIPHCSHWVQQEQPNAVNRLMKDWLQDSKLPDK